MPMINDPDERDRNVAPASFRERDLPPDEKITRITELTKVTENDDGSATVDVEADAPAKDEGEKEFSRNLAGELDEAEVQRLSRQLLDDVKRDQEARKRRDEQYAEGIKRTGLGNEAPGGASFEGASRAVHPALIEGCIDFAARAMKELFPAEGPVKSRIIGDQNKKRVERADRQKRYMNWQLTSQIKEYRRELEVLLTQLPLGGSQYQKFWYDPRWERLRTEFVPIDDLLLPFESTGLDGSLRVTHVQRITKAQYLERVDSGLYRDVGNVAVSLSPERTESAEAAAVVDGADDMGYNEDGLRIVYETQLLISVPKGFDPLAKRPLMPYILTVDESTGKALALRRNWDEEDQDKATPLKWIVEYPFIPWRGAYAIGLAHIIGSMTGAATGALRALLDSAHISNMPGAIKLAGAKISGQNISISPTQITEISAGPGVDDIRKLAMPIPFNPPSTVLFQLLEWITNQAKGVVNTADEKIGDATSNMPVGTALALIEQGAITFSSIHARLHNAQKEALAIIYRLNRVHLTDHEVVEELGELVVSREDFEGPMNVEPVSDPNIFSDAQRYAQLQAVMQLATMAPQLYKMPDLHKRALRLLKFPHPDEVLAVPEDEEERDAISENVAAGNALKTLKAYDNQDHLSHLRVHIAFMSSPVLCANPLMGIPALPRLLEHCKEHLIKFYSEHTKAATEAQLAVTRAQGAFDQAEAYAIAIADQEMMRALAPLMPSLQQAQQMAQQMMPQEPQDPQMAAVQQRAAEAQGRQQIDQKRLELETQKAAMDEQLARIEAQRAAQEASNADMQSKIDAQLAMMEHQIKDREAQNAEAQNNLDRQLEAWQTRVEMMTSRETASLAAQQAEADRKLQLQLKQMAEEAASDRERLSAQVQTVLGLGALQQPVGGGGEGAAPKANPAGVQTKGTLSALLKDLQMELLQSRRRRPARLKVKHLEDGQTVVEPEYDDLTEGEGE